MKIQYLTIAINPPPLDTYILVKKDNGIAKVVETKSREGSQDWWVEFLIGDEFTMWAEI